MTTQQEFGVTAEQEGQTLAALLRAWLPGQSWSQVRKLVASRRVKLNGELWLDDARRLKVGDRVVVLAAAEPRVDLTDTIVLRHVDEHIVVVEKPAGISTVRHPAERDWLEPRRLLVPTLDDLVLRQLGQRLPRRKHEPRPRLRIVHRLDKETSGLVVFARTVDAERGLGRQFKSHTVTRRYLALVPGHVQTQTLRSLLVRERGDGKRGSGANGKEAVTHVEAMERFGGYTLVSCRLETGRTHQIRIHLAELGHPVCGDAVYRGKYGLPPIPDTSRAPRLVLHATELGFEHPVTGEALHWDMPLPPDLREFIDVLRKRASAS
jgi:23S rRNA pseudouridine1911/1915/1917 synthase